MFVAKTASWTPPSIANSTSSSTKVGASLMSITLTSNMSTSDHSVADGKSETLDGVLESCAWKRAKPDWPGFSVKLRVPISGPDGTK
eukprot:3541054-Rhodomonas_salina.1